MIPNFSANGLLPPGIHYSDKAEFIKRFTYNSHRMYLFLGLDRAINELKKAHCQTVYVDGSYTTEVDLPNDYDACWETLGVNPSHLRTDFLDFTPAGRRRLKINYLGDIFPAQITEGGSGLEFLKFFQVDKFSGDTKGIVAINI